MFPVLPILIATPASAWTHTGQAWLPEDMPIRYWVADNGDDGEACRDDPTTPEAEHTLRLNCCEETVAGGVCTDATGAAFDSWLDTPCLWLEAEYGGVIPNDPTVEVPVAVLFDDPTDDIEEVGTIAATFTIPYDEAFIFDGVLYLHTLRALVTLADDVPFTTPDGVASGACEDAYDLYAVLLHEVGHVLGVGHSCEEEADCTDPAHRDAAMYWAVDRCTSIELTDDDREAMELYQPQLDLVCSPEGAGGVVEGAVPFDVACAVASDALADVTEVSWSFGDGTTGDGLAPVHTYTEPGLYTVSATATADLESCDDGELWERTVLRTQYVLACGVPEVEFELEHTGPLAYDVLNDTDLTVFGCTTEIQWDVFEGREASGDPILTVDAWEPAITLPEAGWYTIVAHVGGPAGTGAARLTFRARDREPGGCDSAAGAGVGVLATLAPLAWLRRLR